MKPGMEKADAMRVLSKKELEEVAGATRGSINPPLLTPASQIPWSKTSRSPSGDWQTTIFLN
jgi:hypothetical protein